jgi:hypothetical protein
MRSIWPRIFVMVVPLLCHAVSACGGESASSRQATPDPAQATEGRRVIAAWLECEECTDGELDAVTKLGDAAVPVLGASLRAGLAPATREKLRLHLTATYAELKKHASTHPESAVTGTEEEYVDTYLANYDALHRIRAARALAAIGGPAARAALEEVSRTSLRTDVQAAVQESLARMKG